MTTPELLQANFRLSPAKAGEIAALFREDHLEKGDYFLRRGQSLLIPVFRNKLENETKAGFIAMNEALRDRIQLVHNIPCN